MGLFNRLVFIVFTLIVILNVTTLMADVKKRVAVLEFDAKNVSKTYADIARDILEINLHNTGAFVVVERGQINLILKEQGFQMSGCTDTSCAVQIGKFLSADLVVIGSLSKITTFTLSVKMVDIGKSNIILADTEKAATEDDIENSVKRLAMRFAEKVRGEKEKITPAPASPELAKEKKQEEEKSASKVPAGYYVRGVVFPGWGQMYAGNTGKGLIFVGTFTISAALTIWSGIQYKKAKSDYEGLGVSNSPEEYKDKRDKYKSAAQRTNIMIGVTSAIYLINFFDILIFNKDNFNIADRQHGGGNFYCFNMDYSSLNKKEKIMTALYGIRW